MIQQSPSASRFSSGDACAKIVMGSPSMGGAVRDYRHFLLWSAIGGASSSIYTSGLAYLVETALAGFPTRLGDHLRHHHRRDRSRLLAARKRRRFGETPARQ
ncbi:hypothetical protein OHA10_14570 [Kribbella sp. NBC_00662]|uniref:hypothetical protein n=1 Tax=Kribbella sp. NBC_00662 TaxID=2975969 RepID=UPI00324DD622